MKRFLSLLIGLVLVISTGTMAFAGTSDYEKSWAKDEINYMKGKGIIQGYSNGEFRPNNNISKAEFYKVVNGVMGYTGKAENVFSDVKSSDWFYSEVQKGLGANYLLPDETLNPNENITRGEVARIIAFVFDVEENEKVAKSFIDNNLFSKELKGIIGGLKANGFINGFPDGSFKQDAEITRAEVVKMLYNISGEIVNKSGTISKNVTTNVVVNTDDVLLKDMIIEGNLYLTEGIGDGDVTLNNVTVKGEVIIKGGGENSIIIIDSTLNKVSVDKQQGPIRVVFENTSVEEVKTAREVKLVLTDGTEIKLVELNGKIEVVVEKGAAIVKLDALTNEVIIESKGKIDTIKSTEEIEVNGTKLKANTEYKMEEGKAPVDKSKPKPKPAETSTGGGGGGSYEPSIPDAKPPIEPVYDSTVQDNTDIGTAKANIESATYSSTQVEVRDEATALTKVEVLVDLLELKGTKVNVVAGTFTSAAVGTEENAGGTEGTYTFTVTIDKGKGTQVTSEEQTMTIIATTYEEEQIKKINKGSDEIIPVSVYIAAGITGFSDRLLDEIYDYWEYQEDDLLQRIIQIGKYKKGWVDLTKGEIQTYVTLLSELFKYDMYAEGHIKGNDTAVGTDITDKVMVLYDGGTADTDIQIEFAKYDGPIHEWYEDYHTYTPNVIEIIKNRIVIKELISYREEYYTEDTIPVYLRLKKNDLMIEWVMEFYIERQPEDTLE